MSGTWMNEPTECGCSRMVVETIEETLDCPLGWRWVPEARLWVHA